MRGLAGALDDLARLSGQQWALRLAVVAATAAFLVAAALAGGGVPVLGVGAAVLLCAGSVLFPDSAAPLGLVLVLALQWLVTVPGGLGAWTLVAGLAVLAVHLSCALAASGPPGTGLDRRLLSRWAARAGVLALATAATWGAARALTGREPTPSVWLTGLALVVVAGAALALVARLVAARAGEAGQR
ncbi:MAG: hypothetical protein ACTHOK_18095 [Nocardioidaceae bacterium]